MVSITIYLVIFAYFIQVDVDCSGYIEFNEFCSIMHNKLKDADMENELKETFRVFSKDNEGKMVTNTNTHLSVFQAASQLRN